MAQVPPPDAADNARARRRQAIAERLHHTMSMGDKGRDATGGTATNVGMESFRFPKGAKPGLSGTGWNALPKATAMLESWIASDVPGAQIYVSASGQAVASFGLGWAREGLASTPAVVNPWLCCVKPLLAIAFAQLWEQGLVHPDVRVTQVVPEIGDDKARLTFRHLLCHSAPLRPDPVLRVLFASRVEQLAAIAAAPLPPDGREGFEATYSHAWSWFILAEAVERLGGQPFARYLEENVFAPAGSEFWVQLSSGELEQLWPRIGLMFDLRSGAKRAADATSAPDLFRLRCPGMMGLGTAVAVGRLYEALLSARAGIASEPILRSPTVEAIVRPARIGCYDAHFDGFTSWGLGFLTEPAVFGSYCSPQVFGHVGGLGLLTLADPAHELVIAYAINGMIERKESDQRDVALVDAIYRDLGIGGGRRAPRIVAVEPH